MANKLLFISFNSTKACIFYSQSNEIKEIPIKLLYNLSQHKDIVCCNKLLLKDYFSDSVLASNFKDILYLYAFLYPTRFCSNSIKSLNNTLKISQDFNKSLRMQVKGLYKIYKQLIEDLRSFPLSKQEHLLSINNFISKNINWDWYDTINNVLSNIKLPKKPQIEVWKNFSDCEISFNSSLTTNNKVNQQEIINNLELLTQRHTKKRLNQQEYALTIAEMFNNNTTTEEEQKTDIVLAEAGTGIGKTLGYLAAVLSYIKANPKNNVVISTFSKSLQQQILKELNSSIASNLLDIKVTLIKGNHNYVCLLNAENLLFSDLNGKELLYVGFILRWLSETTYGDIYGGDFLPWLKDLIPNEIISNISNKKEECIYTKCPYYKKCFITKVKEEVKQSNIIISNHTLTLRNRFNTNHIIFDEAHNLYNISDESYTKELSGATGLFLKNWILGYDVNNKIIKNESLNGLQSRLNSILFFVNRKKHQEDNTTSINVNNNDLDNNYFVEEEEIIDLRLKNILKTLIYSVQILPTAEYIFNVHKHVPKGIFEEFLYYVNEHVLLNNSDLNQYYSLESIPSKISENLKQAADKLLYNLRNILNIALSFQEELKKKLEISHKDNKYSLLEFIKSFEYNCINILENFIELLLELSNNNKDYIYRFLITKEDNVVYNIGYVKNYINPLEVLNKNVLYGKKGITFTSATLFNEEIHTYTQEDILKKFSLCNEKIGLLKTVQLTSPFNYIANSKVIILNKNYSSNSVLCNEALLQLFLATKGGALAIFTSLARLKQHYGVLKNKFLLKEQNIKVLAPFGKHKTSSTLIDIFKEDEESCLLGCDSFRDGIDVPGKSLRMVVFEKVPWLKKDILTSARKVFYGKALETDTIKLKLRQAFGRIIRTENDKGIFILLEPGLPSELLSAFPKGVEIQKISLEEAIKVSSSFLEKYIKE